MLERVQAIEFSNRSPNGKTEPSHLVCRKSDGTIVEVIAKFSARCEEGVCNLSREVLAACLAADLGLPIPVPYLVELPKSFAEIAPTAQKRKQIAESNQLAFGSTLITGQYSSWISGNQISTLMLPSALAIFCFDAITQNNDRRVDNPNCIVKLDDVIIFDHEMCFTHDKIVLWQAPWKTGGLENLKTPGTHIFSVGLKGRQLDFDPIRNSWKALHNFKVYQDAIPAEWTEKSLPTIKVGLSLIKDAQTNIDGCITEIMRVLR